MNRFMYWFGIVLAILAIVAGVISFFVGVGVIALVVVLLAYILMVLLDLADKYLEIHK